MFPQKVGVSDHVITVHTGAGDMSRLGQIVNFNGVNDQGVWRSDECNRIEGSDGSQFPPPHVSPSARLFVYNRDMCRRLPLVFDRFTEAQGMPALRFHLPPNVFDNPAKNPNNTCFCHHDDPALCLPSGVFNASACNFGEYTGLKPQAAAAMQELSEACVSIRSKAWESRCCPCPGRIAPPPAVCHSSRLNYLSGPGSPK